MKKDIQITKAENVHVAVVNEYNDIYKTNDWNAYIINGKTVDIEMVLIVSKGFDQNTVTSTMRHKLEKLPAQSYAKIELLQDEMLHLNNEFKVTFFEGNTMFEKTFLFRKNTINVKAFQIIPVMNAKGVLVK